MPYRSLQARRRRYRQRRLFDPAWVRRQRSYHREYQKKWYRKNVADHRRYQREWRRQWRKAHPRKARARARAWRRKNAGKVRLWHKRWRESRAGQAWYRKNRAKRRRRQQKYYRRERRLKLEQQRARRRRYYWKNRGKINLKRRTQRAENALFFRESDRQRYRKHRLRRIVQQRNTQARRAGAIGQITPSQWRNLLKRHRFRCFYCRVKLLPANRTLDHKVPLSRGGTNTIDNVVPACRPCNNRKLRMTTEEFLERRRKTRNPQ